MAVWPRSTTRALAFGTVREHRQRRHAAFRKLSNQGRCIMRKQVILVAAALVLAPLGAQAADLVVWWEKGQYDEEDQAVREIVAAFEEETGKEIEPKLGPQEELMADLMAAREG
jgi:hypothetical protein